VAVCSYIQPPNIPSEPGGYFGWLGLGSMAALCSLTLLDQCRGILILLALLPGLRQSPTASSTRTVGTTCMCVLGVGCSAGI
jgi:hypothetical protein